MFVDTGKIFGALVKEPPVKQKREELKIEKAYYDLFTIADVVGESSILDDKKFNKKFPKLWETDDPEYVKNAIKYVKRMGGL